MAWNATDFPTRCPVGHPGNFIAREDLRRKRYYLACIQCERERLRDWLLARDIAASL